ncbi:leucine-rich repeat transmembrane neuronal protein 2-like [Sitodiplosis mosellana]|uniref:leucine-rich repeat transmembrane neuronal protein 2-like n=1 Tax=Sitodiplosis mosellana TaxID=263140 RepID=UPI0024445051|nr:leucine-rich repeat transmembrane neuronal protein 2-like [Sitodiplosis mosellana]
MLGESIHHLDLSGNILGKVHGTAFRGLNNLERLNLSETRLSFAESNPFKHLNNLEHLDISFNNLSTLNIRLFSKTLSNLLQFRAAGNHFDNCLEIIHCLGSKLYELDLSQSFIGTLNPSTFKHLPSLISLMLKRTNLSIFDVKPFKTLQWSLKYLDISNNNLTKLNFSTSLVFDYLEEITLDENNLTQLDGFTKNSYPKLTKLDITNNKFNCNYLSMFRKEWESLEIIGDRCGQFGNNETQNPTDTSVENSSVENITESTELISTVHIESDKEAQNESTIATNTSVPSSSFVIFYAVPIGVSALIINIIAVVVFLRRKFSSKNSEQMEVSYRRNDNGEELQTVPQPESKKESTPEDHIYEEIEERECPYDRLRF